MDGHHVVLYRPRSVEPERLGSLLPGLYQCEQSDALVALLETHRDVEVVVLDASSCVASEVIPTVRRVFAGEVIVCAEAARLRELAETLAKAPLTAECVLCTPEDLEAELRSVLWIEFSIRTRNETARRFLASIVDSSDDAIIGYDVNGAILSWNRGAERLFGRGESEMVGRSLSGITPDGVDDVAARFKLVVGQRESQRFETRRMAANGEPVELLVTLSPIANDRGQIVGVSEIARNITEHKRLVAELQHARDTLEQRVAARTKELTELSEELASFAYSVSHDLTAPLRVIRGFIFMITDTFEIDNEELHGHMKRIADNAAHMEEMIEALLRLSRVSRAKVNRMSVQLDVMARELIDGKRMVDGGTVDELLIEPELTVVADPTLTRLLLQNLLDNAWKFTGTQALRRIEVGTQRDAAAGEGPVFFVRDNGVGFDMSHARRHLFSPFRRFHAGREFEGHGIGLSIVKRIVALHGGTVWIETEPGGGTAVFFSLGRGAVPPGERYEEMSQS